MAGPATLALVAGGGVAAAVVVQKSAPVPTKLAPDGGIIAQAGASSATTIPELQQTGGTVKIGSFSKILALRNMTALDLNNRLVGTYESQTNPIDAELQKKLDEIEAYAKAAHDKLSADAKKKGAAVLNEELKLDPPLSGTEDWETIAKIAGGAAGAAALGWLPGGQVLGPMVGAYLGVKLEELVNKNYEEIKAWFKTRWADIENWVHGVADDIEEGVKDAIDYIGGWF